MPLVNVTFVRHGESTDNLKDIWAGWKDAPLSNHGMNQAKAAGESLSNTRLAAIVASPLLRAHSTAKAIHAAQPEPKPPLTTSLLIREQHFGIGEGRGWSMRRTHGLTNQEHFDKGLFPVLDGRNESFPDGESLNDLEDRAGRAIDELVMPHIWQSLREGKSDVDIALVSHGLCISELVASLLRRDEEVQRLHKQLYAGTYAGLLNTAWTRISVDCSVAKAGEPFEFSEKDPPPLKIKVVAVNQHEHLDAVRQKGGIGSTAHDPDQSDIRAFFGGKATVDSEEGRSQSNVKDEVDVLQK